MEQPITALQTPDCDWLLHRFIEVNFSKLVDSNQISGMTLFAFIVISVKFQVKLMSAKKKNPRISCNELSITLSTLCKNLVNSSNFNVAIFNFFVKFDDPFSHVFIFAKFPESHRFVAVPVTRSNNFVSLH